MLGIALGAMAILMVHGLTGGRWGTRLVVPLLAAASLLPLLTLLAVPLLFDLQVLYPWFPSHAPAIGAVRGQRWYLNVPGFAVRGAACLLLWNGIVYLLRRSYGDSVRPGSRGAFSPTLCIAGLIAYAITITIASVDWIMSLTPEWYSSAFGLLIMTSQAPLRIRVRGNGRPCCRSRGGSRTGSPGGGRSRQPAADVRHALGLHRLYPISDRMGGGTFLAKQRGTSLARTPDGEAWQ